MTPRNDLIDFANWLERSEAFSTFQVSNFQVIFMAQADRHLLFGLLALQNEFISKEQLVAAFGIWIADRSQSIDEILLQQGALSVDLKGLLTKLVQQHVARKQGDVDASLRSLSGSVAFIRAELEQLADSELLASIDKLPEEDPYATVGYVDSQDGRFQIRRPLDQGGLGIVSVALDKELNREVALKEIRSDRAADLGYQRKFLLEAEITGGLEHPGIVPVYSLGTGPNGRPYYAMRLVRGDNLREHIKRFQADIREHKESFDSSSFRKLLRRFLDICEAVGYAHARGVLHRDLNEGKGDGG